MADVVGSVVGSAVGEVSDDDVTRLSVIPLSPPGSVAFFLFTITHTSIIQSRSAAPAAIPQKIFLFLILFITSSWKCNDELGLICRRAAFAERITV